MLFYLAYPRLGVQEASNLETQIGGKGGKKKGRRKGGREEEKGRGMEGRKEGGREEGRCLVFLAKGPGWGSLTRQKTSL